MQQKYFLDDIQILRGFACCLVLLQHIIWPAPYSIIRDILPRWLLVGCGGVSIFFVISGFVITLTLRDKFESINQSSFLERMFAAKELLITFLKKRFFRIVPVVFLVWILSVIFLLCIELDEKDLSFFFRTPFELLTGTFSNAVHKFSQIYHCYLLTIGSFWTLSLEYQFYLFWPIIMLLCPNNSSRTVLSFVLGLIFLLIIQPLAAGFYGFQYYLLHNYFDEVFLGCFCGFIYKNNDNIASTSNKIVSILLALSLWIYPSLYEYEKEFYSQTVINTLAVLLVFSVTRAKQTLCIPLVSKFLKVLGDRSFSFYSIQLLLAQVVLYYTNSIHFPKEWFSEYEFAIYQFLIFIVSLCVLTELCYRFIEKPFRNYNVS